MNDTLIFVLMFSGIWTLVGIIFLLIGVIMKNNMKKKELKCTFKTYGKVTDIVKRTHHDNDGGYSSSWHPIFEYNIGELKFIKEYSYGSSPSKYAIGQTVEIYYNPEDYHDFYIGGDTLPKTLAKVFTIIGIIAITVAIVSAILILKLNIMS